MIVRTDLLVWLLITPTGFLDRTVCLDVFQGFFGYKESDCDKERDLRRG